MMASRTLVSLGDDRIARLDQIAAELGRSRAAVIRDAVDRLIASDAEEGDRQRRRTALRAGFGAWKDRTDIGDAVEWQRRERASWTRPWDDDYEGVKAEFPDLFDAEDDRQRAIYRDQLRGVQPSPKS
ncbi:MULTISPECIES: ribbon-helix-helix domain-containing protein [unclassified Sphingomonas]|uniref:ribbon-helix-helix domain-containing protein n=1 Tax=unclassified Sphingomonas TaxID=196159 RepID=UPI001F5888E4|nr:MULTISPECIES: ribbon-helix-helix domain-containing protein [unclassified Sphingomonas]